MRRMYSGSHKLRAYTAKAVYAVLHTELHEDPRMYLAWQPAHIFPPSPPPDLGVIRRAIESLPESQQVVVLAWMHGCSFAEIAAGLRRTRETVRMWFRDALEALRCNAALRQEAL